MTWKIKILEFQTALTTAGGWGCMFTTRGQEGCGIVSLTEKLSF